MTSKTVYLVIGHYSNFSGTDCDPDEHTEVDSIWSNKKNAELAIDYVKSFDSFGTTCQDAEIKEMEIDSDLEDVRFYHSRKSK